MAGLAVWTAKTAKKKALPLGGGGRKIFDYLILKWHVSTFDLRYSEVQGTYSRTHSLNYFNNRLAFLANALSTSSFAGQCSWWHCSKKSASSRSSIMVEWMDDWTSLRAAFLGWSAVSRRLETWRCCIECCRSSVWTLFCCSRCPLTSENILAAKISRVITCMGGFPSKYVQDEIPGLTWVWIVFLCHS